MHNIDIKHHYLPSSWNNNKITNVQTHKKISSSRSDCLRGTTGVKGLAPLWLPCATAGRVEGSALIFFVVVVNHWFSCNLAH